MKISPTHHIHWNSCNVNCGSRCALKVHVEERFEDGVKKSVITQIESDTTGDDTYGQHQLRACPRGRSMRQLVYAKERLLYPMKRVKPRGQCAETDPAKQIEAGQFERISWEQAFAEIAERLHGTLKKYGNEAVFVTHGSGSRSTVIGKSCPVEDSPLGRLMNTMGGYLNHYGDYSSGQITMGMASQFGGDWAYGSALSTMRHSELIVFFGQNPSETRMSGSKVKTLQYATQNKTRTIIIDPRYSDSMVSVGSEWIPIRPSTDAALCSALAYVMMTESLVDMDFIEKYTVGYETYRAYILGISNGIGNEEENGNNIPKTPEWAAPITGIPAERITTLAREIAAEKPCFISQGWGPQRTTYGEDACRAIAMLAILTGNVGIVGGNTGARENNGMSVPMAAFPVGENPVKTAVSHFNWYEAIDMANTDKTMTALNAGIRGKMSPEGNSPNEKALTAPIKFIWNYAGNGLTNQHGGINQMHRILSDETKCETIVVMDTHMTASARYADYILPCTTTLETPNWALGLDANMGFVVFDEQCIQPLGESRAIYDICSGVAAALDTVTETAPLSPTQSPTNPTARQPVQSYAEAFTEGRSHNDWLEHLYVESQTTFAEQGLPPLPATLADAFKQGIYRHHYPHDHIAYEAFRRDPVANPLDTPSGKIEIYSNTFAQYADTWELLPDQYISPIPEYRHDPEGAHAPLTARYPLQLIGHHYKQRTHSNFGTCSWLQEVAPQTLWMNPIDAAARNITHGDMVKVYNDRGATLVPVKVTSRIMPHVVSLPQGAWHTPEPAANKTAEQNSHGQIAINGMTEQNAVGQNAINKTARQNVIEQNTIGQDATNEAAYQSSIGQNAINEAAGQNIAGQNTIGQDATNEMTEQNAVGQNTIGQDATNEMTEQNAVGQNTIEQDATNEIRDSYPLDTNGCVNVLTALQPTALSKSNPHHSNLVEVVKIERS